MKISRVTQTKVLLATTVLFQLCVCSDRFQPHPSSNAYDHIQDKDYTDFPLVENWDKSAALFETKSLTVQEYDTVWEGAHRTFRGDNYYTVLIKGGESVTLAEFAYEAIKMSKAVINYHCSNLKSTNPANAELVIYDHEHRIYHKAVKTADILRIDLKSPGDIRLQFTNPAVR